MIIDRAKSVVREANRGKPIRGRIRPTLVASAVYNPCRETNTPQTGILVGDPEKNIANIDINRRHFKILIQEKAEIVRIALHPRDPRIAFRDQMNMILQLKEQGF